MADDYYSILGVSRSASQAEIEKGYHKMARKNHPDLLGDDVTDAQKERAKEKFQETKRAYDVLNDPEKRKLYDQFGSEFEKMQGAGPQPGGWNTQGFGGGGGGTPFSEIDLSDLFGGAGGPGGRGQSFEDFVSPFGGQPTRQRSRPRPRKGADVTYETTVPFKTAVEGGEVELALDQANRRNMTVKIPAGIEDGKKIRLRGQGEPSPTGGQPGDALIIVHVQSHPHFQRRGHDLIVKVPVRLGEAALGAKVDVPTPKGTVALTVPPGTSSGKRLRVKGFGVARAKGKPGDLYAEIQIELPESLDDTTREYLKKIDEQQTQFNPRSDLQW